MGNTAPGAARESQKGGTPPAFDVKQFKDHYPDAKPGMRTVMLDLLFEWLRLALKPGRVKERWSEILAVLAFLENKRTATT